MMHGLNLALAQQRNGAGGGGASSRNGFPFGDSRADVTFGDVTIGADLHTGAALTRIGGSPSSTTHHAYIPYLLPDFEFSANGGVSGDNMANWASGARLRTAAACVALGGQWVTVQGGTNDIFNGVSDAPTQASVRAALVTNLQAICTYFIGFGFKVVWETIFQRTAAGYGAASTFKRDCCDQVNSDMITWCAGQGTTNLRVSDIRAITNIGGVTSGAYLLAAYADGTGTHLNYTGVWAVLPTLCAQLRLFFSDNGLPAMYRGTGTNLVATVDATSILGVNPINCTLNSTSYLPVGGDPAVTFMVTPGGADSLFMVEVHADVGSSGPRTPANTISIGQKIKGEWLCTLDNGSGGISSAWNLWTNWYATFIGGPAEVRTQVSDNAAGVTAMAALANGRVMTVPLTLTGNSSNIAAPAAGTGMRFWIIVYAPAGGAQYRLIVRRPRMQAIT